MQRQLGEQRKEPQTEDSLVDYQELLQLLSSIPHSADESDELALLFRHFDMKASPKLSVARALAIFKLLAVRPLEMKNAGTS